MILPKDGSLTDGFVTDDVAWDCCLLWGSQDDALLPLVGIHRWACALVDLIVFFLGMVFQ